MNYVKNIMWVLYVSEIVKSINCYTSTYIIANFLFEVYDYLLQNTEFWTKLRDDWLREDQKNWHNTVQNKFKLINILIFITDENNNQVSDNYRNWI